METLHDIVERLLLATPHRAGDQEPVITASQVVHASGQTLADVRSFLEARVERGTLYHTSSLVAACPHCGMVLSLPARVAVGESSGAPPISLRLIAVWCPRCQQLRPLGDLRTEPGYTGYTGDTCASPAQRAAT